MIWSVPELIAELSKLYHLAPGDLIYTGTPAGVGPIAPGDALVGSIDGLAELTLTIADAE
jgi:fumarylpyruvate hydrolase